MRRQIALAAVFVSIGLVAGLPARQATSSAPQQSPVFRSGAAFVRVDVYPSKDGRIVRGLTKDDFQILEDGKPQKIETFDFVDFPTFASETERRDPATKSEGDAMAADPRNRVFVVYLDTFHVSIPEAHRTRVPLGAMLDRTIGPSDVFGVLTPQQTYADLVFGRKVQGTEDMLARKWAWGDSNQVYTKDPVSEALRECYVQIMSKDDIEVLVDRERMDRSIRRLEELVEYLGRLRQERKNVLIFSHGWNLYGPAPYLMTAIDRAPQRNVPSVSPGGRLGLTDRSTGRIPESTCETDRVRLANEDFIIRFRELLDAAKRANVSFYPVNPAGLDPDVTWEETYQRWSGQETAVDRLRELAGNTDGIAIVNTNDLRTAMMKITDSLSAYYLVGYYPTNSRQDGTVRSISVKGPAGLDLKSRRQYRAADEKEEAKGRASAPARESSIAATPDLDAAFATLARNTASRSELTATAAMTTNSELVVVAEAARPVAADTDLQVIVNDVAGNTVGSSRGRLTAGSRGVAMRLPIAATAPGPWQAVMRATGGDARGGEAVPIQRPTGAIGDAYLQRIDGTSVSAVANPVFARREHLRVTWTTMAGAELTQQVARVLDRRGQPLPIDAATTSTPVGTRTATSVDIVMAPLAPGDYLVELIVTSADGPTRRLVAFRVIQ